MSLAPIITAVWSPTFSPFAFYNLLLWHSLAFFHPACSFAPLLVLFPLPGTSHRCPRGKLLLSYKKLKCHLYLLLTIVWPLHVSLQNELLPPPFLEWKEWMNEFMLPHALFSSELSEFAMMSNCFIIPPTLGIQCLFKVRVLMIFIFKSLALSTVSVWYEPLQFSLFL